MFGDDACTTGSESDFENATALAAQYVRHFGFGTRLSRTDVTEVTEANLNTDVAPTNAEIEWLLTQEYDRAQTLLKTDPAVLLEIVDELLASGQLSKEKMLELLGTSPPREEQMLHPYAASLATFAMQQELMRRVRAIPQLAPEVMEA